jgi:hypothetical protein
MVMKPLRHVLAAVPVLVLLVPGLEAQISGTVIDSTTMAPIADALVGVQATGPRSTTAGNGTFALAAAGANLTVVAAKKGYFNASVVLSAPTGGATIALVPVPLGNNLAYQLIDPVTCGICHSDQYTQWADSPMNKAGTNTWVYDIYDGSGSAGGLGGFVYTRDSAFRISHPNSDCASCHQPEPWVKQPYRAMEPLGGLSTAAMHGVSCEVCHKIANVDEQKMNFPGIYPGYVDFNLPNAPVNSNQVIYGVLGDTNFHSPGLMRPSFQPQLVAQVCGTCHQDKNDPDGDDDFEEANGVISEPTFHEWLASPYGDPDSPDYRSCVDCHMPPTGAIEACNILSLARDPNTIRSHRIEGTTPAFLENAVELDMQVSVGPRGLDVRVDVDNRHTGHHVPTGVTVRNMILLVEAWRVDNGQRLALAGGPTLHALAGVGSPDQGYYAGLPGKLYAKRNHDVNGNSPTFFTEATGILDDTRIPAMAVDTTKYRFTMPDPATEVTVRARLIYRRAWRALVDAKQWTTNGHGNPLADVAAPYFGHLMEEEQWSTPRAEPVARFGVGCEGLAAAWQNTPHTGQQFVVELSGAAGAGPALFWLGLDDTTYGGLPLPLDLTILGAPGCSLLAPIDASYLGASDAQGAATMPIHFPHPGPIGLTVYGQWAAISSNPFGLALSDGLRITFQR